MLTLFFQEYMISIFLSFFVFICLHTPKLKILTAQPLFNGILRPEPLCLVRPFLNMRIFDLIQPLVCLQDRPLLYSLICPHIYPCVLVWYSINYGYFILLLKPSPQSIESILLSHQLSPSPQCGHFIMFLVSGLYIL